MSRPDLRITYPFPLRGDFIAHVDLPFDLTAAEAERVATFVRAIPLDDAARTKEGP